MFTEVLASTLWAPAVFNDSAEQALLMNYFDQKPFGTFVDVGANDPANSVSRFLWGSWVGVIVEPLPEQASKFRGIPGVSVAEVALASAEISSRGTVEFSVAGKQSTLVPDRLMDQKVIDRVIEVQTSTLQQTLIANGIAKFDFLSVDVEGAEPEVLGDFDFDQFEIDLVLVEDWGREFTLHRLMRRKGYKRVRRTGFNSWYVSKEKVFSVSLLGRLQLVRKYFLGMPFRRFRKWRHDHFNKSDSQIV